MTPTPRTDAEWQSITVSAPWDAAAEQMAQHARQLERENQTFRAAQKACEDCDAPRVDRIADLERELAELTEWREWSSKLADFADDLRADLATEREQLAANHEATRLMGKWLEAERELADRLAGVLLSYDHDMLAGEDMQWLPEHDKSLAAWKEARSGTV